MAEQALVQVSMEALEAFEELRRQAADVPEMSLEEINAEISAARAERNECMRLVIDSVYPSQLPLLLFYRALPYNLPSALSSFWQ